MSVDPYPYPDKKARHELISRICSFALFENEEFGKKIRHERRQKNEDVIWINVSLFTNGDPNTYPGQDKKARHESYQVFFLLPYLRTKSLAKIRYERRQKKKT
jgi:hypothetical protein